MLLAKGQEKDPELEMFDYLSIPYAGDASQDYEGAQVYMVQLYAGDSDLYIQNEQMTNDLIAEGIIFCTSFLLSKGLCAF